jgi:hypothetical protein
MPSSHAKPFLGRTITARESVPQPEMAPHRTIGMRLVFDDGTSVEIMADPDATGLMWQHCPPGGGSWPAEAAEEWPLGRPKAADE